MFGCCRGAPARRRRSSPPKRPRLDRIRPRSMDNRAWWHELRSGQGRTTNHYRAARNQHWVRYVSTRNAFWRTATCSRARKGALSSPICRSGAGQALPLPAAHPPCRTNAVVKGSCAGWVMDRFPSFPCRLIVAVAPRSARSYVLALLRALHDPSAASPTPVRHPSSSIRSRYDGTEPGPSARAPAACQPTRQRSWTPH
jgi:hypothetical protein